MTTVKVIVSPILAVTWEETGEGTAASSSKTEECAAFMTQANIDDVLTVSMFADRAGITTQAVRKMIAEGRLKAIKLGEQYVINKEDLEHYLE